MKGVAMPPKDTPTGSLYYSTDDGKTYNELGVTIDASAGCMPYEPSDDEILEFLYPKEREMTFTATTITNRFLMQLLLGNKKYIPNNWLKMHGYPMRRKQRR